MEEKGSIVRKRRERISFYSLLLLPLSLSKLLSTFVCTVTLTNPILLPPLLLCICFSPFVFPPALVSHACNTVFKNYLLPTPTDSMTPKNRRKFHQILHCYSIIIILYWIISIVNYCVLVAMFLLFSLSVWIVFFIFFLAGHVLL